MRRWNTRLEDVVRKLEDQSVLRSHSTHRPDLHDPYHVSEQIREVAAETASDYGMGPRSSALITGYTHLHAKLEEKLADLTRKERGLLFPTVVTEGDKVAIFSDEFNHASIIDGARLARQHGASVSTYRHNDLRHLEELLQKSPSTYKLVVTETLFSMDGDLANLKGLAALKRRYGFLLLVDEAHAMLVAGDRGGGVSERDGVQDHVDVVVGTLSKAFGSMGGFVCSSYRMRQLLVSRGRGHIFSTSLPMPVVAAAIRAIDVSHREEWRRKHLSQLVHHLSTQLHIPVVSWIVPVVIGSAEDALRISRTLKDEGFFIPAIRPPTVPPGTCRLRISLSAKHSFEELDRLILSLKQLT